MIDEDVFFFEQGRVRRCRVRPFFMALSHENPPILPGKDKKLLRHFNHKKSNHKVKVCSAMRRYSKSDIR